MNILSVISVILGIAGLGYALYQSHERQKLQDYNRSEAWYLYAKTNNMIGFSQIAFHKYKEIHADSLNVDLIELLSKSYAFGIDLFRETARLIQLSENEFTYESIELWANSGKINTEHKMLFTSLVVESNSPGNRFKRICHKIKKPFR